jgi:hypothetical protein
MKQKCGPHMEHQPTFKLRLDKSVFAEASAFNFTAQPDDGTGKCAKKSHGVSDKPYDD